MSEEKVKLFSNLQRIRREYENGVNIIQLLQSEYGNALSKEDYIKVSYDLQAGTYTQIFDEKSQRKIDYCEELVAKLDKLGPIDSFLLVGVGEAITLGNVVSRMKNKPNHVFGFDLSWSRVYFGKKFLERFDIDNVELCTGNLFDTPFLNDSIDLVMTNHSLEPNGGKEIEALKELYRVSAKYIVINEPSYHFADDEGKSRIDRHGYVKNLHIHAEKLGYKIQVHEKFEKPIVPSNPTSYILIEKLQAQKQDKKSFYACPVTKHRLNKMGDSYFSESSLLSYPIVGGIPCLNPDNAILTSAR